jgi:hypothetical protein
MTDKEIVKALKVCAKNETPFCCGECELGGNNSSCDCVDRLLKLSLDLINRQQAEIERSKEEVASKTLKCNLLEQEKAKNISGFVDDLKLVRADAIKELEAKIHEKLHEAEMHGNFEPVVTREMFDSVVKEMVGEGK